MRANKIVEHNHHHRNIWRIFSPNSTPVHPIQEEWIWIPLSPVQVGSNARYSQNTETKAKVALTALLLWTLHHHVLITSQFWRRVERQIFLHGKQHASWHAKTSCFIHKFSTSARATGFHNAETGATLLLHGLRNAEYHKSNDWSRLNGH